MKCDLCSKIGFKSAAHLGRHKRAEHGILGKHAKIVSAFAERVPEEDKHEEFSKESSTDKQVDLLSFTSGEVLAHIRNVAVQHNIPARDFTARCIEYLQLCARG